MVLDIVFILASLVILYFGAEWLVSGASSLAVRLGVPVIVVGLTVVAYGTSAPELVVSLQGALEGRGGIAAGNVVGSNIFNLCVILAVAAMFKPIHAKIRMLRADIPIMILVALAGFLVLMDGRISRVEGVILLIASVSYTVANYLQARRAKPDEIAEVAPEVPAPAPFWLVLLKLVGGLVTLIIGSRLLVVGSVGIAELWGVSEAIIGLTIISAGTSMPELATSVVAARKGESDIALGNVVGSSIFNVLFILGAAATVSPFAAEGITRVDLWVMVGSSLILWPIIWTGRRITRLEGGVFLAIYGTYLWFLWPN